MDKNKLYVCGNTITILETKHAAENYRKIIDGWYGTVSRKTHEEKIDLLEQTPAMLTAQKSTSNFWEKKLYAKVSHSMPGEPILVVEQIDGLCNVVIGEKVGWIVEKYYTLFEHSKEIGLLVSKMNNG